MVIAGATGGEAVFVKAFFEVALLVPPGQGFGQVVHKDRVQTQSLAHIAYCAARPIGNDRGGKGGAAARVFVVDVLNDLFAAFVLKVHIDVGGLVALTRDKTLEQQ